MIRRAAALAFAVLMTAPAWGAVRDVPFLSGRVVDEAALLPPLARTALEAKLAALEQETKVQVAVLTVLSLDGEPIEDFSHRVAETWKLGDAKRDDGVLFLVARDDRKMRIEVGYGLEPTLTDIRTRRIQDDLVRPAFRSGDFAGGIEKGIDAIGAQLRGQEPPAAPQAASPPLEMDARLVIGGMLLVIVLVFGGVGLWTPGCASWGIYAIVAPFVALLGGVATSGRVAVWLLLVWLIGFPLLRLWLRLTGRVKKAPSGMLRGSKGNRGWIFSGGSGSSSGSSSWSSSSSSSSGGFSGGGGSFGGGGSSSSW